MRPLYSAALPAVLMLAACGTPSPPDYQGGGATMLEARPEAMRAEGWLEFADLSLRSVADGREPQPPYVRGLILGGAFEPTGDVEGVMEGPARRREVIKGWLDLRTRSFFTEDAVLLRRGPYVEGYRDKASGGFYPTSGVRTPESATAGGAP